MREEYDLKKLKVKRRGLLPELKDEKGKQAKVRITISLDQDIVNYFKQPVFLTTELSKAASGSIICCAINKLYKHREAAL